MHKCENMQHTLKINDQHNNYFANISATEARSFKKERCHAKFLEGHLIELVA